MIKKKNILNNFLDLELIGNQMYELMEELFPITRSITGEGVRKSLKILQNLINLKIHEIPTGSKVFDWTVPQEWNIDDAYIMNSKKEKIVDYQIYCRWSAASHQIYWTVPSATNRAGGTGYFLRSNRALCLQTAAPACR